jgi:hypothetical protein
VTTTEKRLTGIIGKLSPEEKAKLVIEDVFRDEPVLAPDAQSKMLQAMGAEEGRRYNAVIDRYSRLKNEVVFLQDMANKVKLDLLERDRILWYQRGLEDMVAGLSFSEEGKALLVDNPNLKPGKPLAVRLAFATLRLGVWGRKRQTYPSDGTPQVELGEKPMASLELYAKRIRDAAADMKAILAYVVEEAQEVGLDVIEEWALLAVEDVRQHDRPPGEVQIDYLMKKAREEGEEATREDVREALSNFVLTLPNVQKDGEIDWPLVWEELRTHNPRGAWSGAIIPVDERWQLVWEDVEANSETGRRIREAPEKFTPASWDSAAESLPSSIRDFLKAGTRERAGK